MSRYAIGFTIVVAVLVALILLSLLSGTVWMSPSAFFAPDESGGKLARLILFDLRLPRRLGFLMLEQFIIDRRISVANKLVAVGMDQAKFQVTAL